jgi:hypothetical protein
VAGGNAAQQRGQKQYSSPKNIALDIALMLQFIIIPWASIFTTYACAWPEHCSTHDRSESSAGASFLADSFGRFGS